MAPEDWDDDEPDWDGGFLILLIGILASLVAYILWVVFR